MRNDHPVLIQKRHFAFDFQDTLDDEHHIGPPGVIFVEANGHRILQRPRQNALAELGHLHAVTDDDGVFADQIDAADMAVQINANARPIEARRHLLEMGRFAGAVIALDHDAPIVGEASQQAERGVVVKALGRINRRDMLFRLGERRDFHVAVDAERLAHRYGDVGNAIA